jgi:hypothetical protein
MATDERGRPPTGRAKWDPDAKIWNALATSWQHRGPQAGPMPGIAEHEKARAEAMAKVLALRAQPPNHSLTVSSASAGT